MTVIPAQPLIYHITHMDNLPGIITANGLWSDAAILEKGGSKASIGMSAIKERRLGLPVVCHPGDHVGEYVPFYFCPRSIMLFLINRANHPDLDYRGGQDPIVHLEADLQEVVKWADTQNQRWAFTLSNAGAAYTEFRRDLSQLAEVDWEAVAAEDFRSREIKEGKQAEFLVRDFLPWQLIRRIGVVNEAIKPHVLRILDRAAHRPTVEVRREWYF
jgi:hypothetical protein